MSRCRSFSYAILVAGLISVSSSETAAPSAVLGREERQAFISIETQAQAAYQALAARIQASPDGPARRGLMLRVVELKRDTELRRLRTFLEFARRCGDLERAAHSQRAIDAIASPHPPSPSPSMDGRLPDKRLPN